jgi:hypothetical protein
MKYSLILSKNVLKILNGGRTDMIYDMLWCDVIWYDMIYDMIW